MTLLYSSYATTAFVPGVADPVAVPAETAGVYGTPLPRRAMSGALGGLSGSGVFQAVITDGADGLGFSGSVSYSLADSLYLMGSATSSPAVSLDKVSLTADLAGDEFEIDLVGSGDLDVGGSDMPLAVGVDVDLVDLSFGFSATVAGGDPVADAFGYQGLDLQNLAVAGAVGGDPELAFAAAADLPSSWDGSLGVPPRTPISLAVDLSATPCLQFSVGQADQTVAAVDFMNEGVLVADYANLVLAPVGCQFADVTIAPGFALDFDGFVSGDPVDFNSSLDLGDSGFALTASLAVGEFDLGGTTTLTDTSFDLDLDPAADVFSIDVSATVDVAGNSLAISGDYDQTGPGAVTASFQASTSGAVSVAGFDFDDATVSLTYRDSPAGSALSFSLDGDVSFLDQSLDGTLALTAANGTVVSASGNLDVSVDLDIVTVTGPLQFSYRAGQGATAQFGPGTVDAFGVQFTGVTGSLQPDGSYEVRAVTGIPEQNASAADAWLYGNEGGEFNTTFFGELDVTITGGNGESATVGYQGSWVAMSSEWAEHTWDSYGDDVALPAPGDGCPAPFVAGDGVAGTPAANFWLNPVATEEASTGDSDDDDNYCIPFQSQIV
ncbi:MAG: hypothetical protein U0R64_05490 [Candidatus Nanopelagicales bacterium]